MNKYSVNEEYFSILTIENCYWGGLLASDGWVESNRDRVGLQLSDTTHVDLFKSSVQYTGPIGKRQNYKDGIKGKESKYISIVSSKWKEDLKRNFNIIPNKTYTLEPPNLNKIEYVVSYLVGLIDGDGSVINHKATGGVIIRFLGTESLLEWVRRWINLLVPSKGTTSAKVKRHKPECETLYRYEIAGRRSSEFFELVNPLGVPYMKIKWDKLASF